MAAMFLRIPGERVRDARQAAREALEIVERIREAMSRDFELAVRTGLLEELFAKLEELISLLLSYGFVNARYARERSGLLARYAHALRVRLRARPEGVATLHREYNDFKSHLEYIEAVLVEVEEIASRLPGGGSKR